jgi:transposase InsO family protein
MSRRGNCHDNALAESFFPLKREHIHRKIRGTRDEAKQDVFGYIRCSTIGSVGMASTKNFQRWILKSYISNALRGYREPESIQLNRMKKV